MDRELGTDQLETGDLRNDDKGRHTGIDITPAYIDYATSRQKKKI